MGQRVFALVGVALWISSCGSDDPAVQECTLIGCNSGVSISIPSFALGEPGGLPAGSYEIAIEYDGVVRTCSGDPAERNTPFQCDGDNDLLAYPQDELARRPGGLFLRLDYVTPAAINVVVRRGGAALASAALEPSYTTWYPNGVACGGPCRQAQLELDQSARRP